MSAANSSDPAHCEVVSLIRRIGAQEDCFASKCTRQIVTIQHPVANPATSEINGDFRIRCELGAHAIFRAKLWRSA